MKIFGVLALLVLPAALLAQSPPAAKGGVASLWAGGEYTSFNPDYGCSSNSPFRCQQVMGPTAFFDFNLRPKWGAEGEAHWLHWNGQGGQSISNYLLGGRYRLLRFHRLSAWGKLLAGGGWITTSNYPEAGSVKGSFFAYVPGATAEFTLTNRISLRGDYEYQFWPSFYGPPTYSSTGAETEHDHELTPTGLSVGVTYRFLGQ